MRFSLIAALTVLCLTSGALCEDAKQFFDSLYGNRVKQVKASVDRADDLVLAKDILAAAQSLDRTDAISLMCDNVVDLSQRQPSGLPTAIEALRLIEEKVEPRRAEARKTLIDLLTRQSATGNAELKQKASDELIELLVKQGDEAAQAKKPDEAATSYRLALAAAQRTKSPDVEAIRTKIEAIGNQTRVEKQIARLREKLLADANDTASADEIVRLYLVDLDDPAQAMKHLDRAKDAKLKKMVPLAAAFTDDATALSLGEWYVELANAAAASAKENMWRRASAHLTHYLASQPTDNLARTKGALYLKSVDAAIIAMAGERPKTEVSPSSPEKWISEDATYQVSSQFEFATLPELLSGGNGIHRNDFAFHTAHDTPGQYIIIDLGRPKIVSKIWIENRRKADMLYRAQGFNVSLANNLKDFGKPVWTAEKAEREWTIQLPQKVKVRYIRIQQAETNSQPLHLAQVKIFGWDVPAPPGEVDWISKNATYELSATEPMFPPLPALLTGGYGLHHQGEFAFHSLGGATSTFIVIDLGKEKLVKCIWIENRRAMLRERAKGMTVSLSDQPDEKAKPIWTAEKGESDWTIELPQKMKARYITIRHADNTDGFHLAQVKVFGWDR